MIDYEKTHGKGFVETVKKVIGFIRERPAFYYDVPPCPECKSPVTGHYVRQPLTESYIHYVKEEALKHGELVRLVPQKKKKNAYCEACGHEWAQDIPLRIKPASYIEEEKQKRGIAARYAEFRGNNPKKRPIWRKFTGFFS